MSKLFARLESPTARIVAHVTCLLLTMFVTYFVWSIWVDSDVSLYNTNVLQNTILLNGILVGCLLSLFVLWAINFAFFLFHSFSKKHREEWHPKHFSKPLIFTVVAIGLVIALSIIVWLNMSAIALSLLDVAELTLERASFNSNNVWIPFSITVFLMVTIAIVQLQYLPPMNAVPPISEQRRVHEKLKKQHN